MSAITASTVARTSGVLPRFTLFCAGSFNITESTAELIAVVAVMSNTFHLRRWATIERPGQASKPGCGNECIRIHFLPQGLAAIRCLRIHSIHEAADVAAVTVRSKTKESHSEHPRDNRSATRR
jgi:hypothetical protein